MFARLIGFILLVSAGYVLIVFVSPDFADTYGNKELNAKIRNIKEQSLNLGSGDTSPASLIDQLSGKTREFASGAQVLVDETAQTVKQIQTTVVEKTEQVQQATNSVKRAYDAVNTAKNDITKLTDFSGSVSK